MECNLLGQKIVIKDTEKNRDERESAVQAIQIAKEKVLEIQTGKPNLNSQQIAVLALVEMACSLVKDRKMIDQYREELDRKCSSLMDEVATVSRLERPSA